MEVYYSVKEIPETWSGYFTQKTLSRRVKMVYYNIITIIDLLQYVMTFNKNRSDDITLDSLTLKMYFIFVLLGGIPRINTKQYY